MSYQPLVWGRRVQVLQWPPQSLATMMLPSPEGCVFLIIDFRAASRALLRTTLHTASHHCRDHGRPATPHDRPWGDRTHTQIEPRKLHSGIACCNLLLGSPYRQYTYKYIRYKSDGRRNTLDRFVYQKLSYKKFLKNCFTT